MAKVQREAREHSIVVISSDDEDFRPVRTNNKPIRDRADLVETSSASAKLAQAMQKKEKRHSSSSASKKCASPPRLSKPVVVKKAPTTAKAKSKTVAVVRRPASPVEKKESRDQEDPSPSSSKSSTTDGDRMRDQRSKRRRSTNDSESESSSPAPRRLRRRFDRGSSDKSDAEEDWVTPESSKNKISGKPEEKRGRGRPRRSTAVRARSSETRSPLSHSPVRSPPSPPPPPRIRNDEKKREPSPVRATRKTRGHQKSQQGSPQKLSPHIGTEGSFQREELPKKAAVAAKTESTEPACVLCERSDVDQVRYFRMDNQDDLHAHYLCLFTASDLRQTEDARVKKAGTICGFLCKNVEKERRRARLLHCKYCKKRGAAVGCSVRSCRATYHYPCGVENKCFYRFTGSFESFCPDHIPAKEFPRPKDMKSVNTQCVVCLDDPDLKDKFDTLVTPCCNRALHRECLAGHAVNAGKHFLKCPSCNIVDNFKPFCEKVGIHIPNADATWMADEEAEREREDQEPGEDLACAAGDDCMCPNGKTFDENVAGREWNIEACGNGCQKQMHAACMKHVGKKNSERRNVCLECFELEVKVEKQLGRKISVSPAERASRSGSPEIPMTRPAQRPRGRPARN